LGPSFPDLERLTRQWRPSNKVHPKTIMSGSKRQRRALDSTSASGDISSNSGGKAIHNSHYIQLMTRMTIPAAAVGHREVESVFPRLPVELCLSILNHLEIMGSDDNQQLRKWLLNVSLVCRLFRELVLPRLFRTASFSWMTGKKENKNSLKAEPRTQCTQYQLLMELGSAPPSNEHASAIAPLVREVIVFNALDAMRHINRVGEEPHLDDGWANDPGFVKLLIRALPALCNAEKLIFFGMRMTEELLSIVGRLSALRSLYIRSCVVTHLSTNAIPSLKSLKLKDINISLTNPSPMASYFSFSHATTISLHTDSFLRLMPCNLLHTLTINKVFRPRQLILLLKDIPSLKCLLLDRIEIEAAKAFVSLQNSNERLNSGEIFLQNLEVLTCPSSMLPAFAACRMEQLDMRAAHFVHSGVGWDADIRGPDSVLTIPLVHPPPFSSVTTLTMNVAQVLQTRVAGSIKETFPNVRILDIGARDMGTITNGFREVLERICRVLWTRKDDLPPILVLKFHSLMPDGSEMGKGSVAVQRSLVDRIVNTGIESLDQIEFGMWAVWTRRWMVDDDGARVQDWVCQKNLLATG
jgi:hypothetical protein